MVAMFSFFYGAAEPIISNCFPLNNDGYDYLMFPSTSSADYRHGFACIS